MFDRHVLDSKLYASLEGMSITRWHVGKPARVLAAAAAAAAD